MPFKIKDSKGNYRFLTNRIPLERLDTTEMFIEATYNRLYGSYSYFPFTIVEVDSDGNTVKETEIPYIFM